MSTDTVDGAVDVEEGGLAEAALPTAADVRGLLNGLFDRPVTVHAEPAPVLPGRGVHVVGSYLEDTGTLRALVLCDLTLGCVLGAALALVPMPRVQEALDAQVVPQDLADNTQEVLNVAASLFNGASAHLKLRAVQVAPEPVTPDVVDFLRAAPHRVDLTVEVPGYGTGVLVLLLAQPGG
ncbi:MAG: hypothetical protein JWO60_924 [Frankiales bacterium]|nr:hypothetical protein [Frankiales bacterium]